MNVSQLISASFALARSQHDELEKKWIDVSLSLGSRLPNSMLTVVVQRIGELDLILRCMEDEFKKPVENSAGHFDFSLHYMSIFSNLWVCDAYEVFRLLKSRKLVSEDENFSGLAHDLRLLRISLAKHEIAADRDLPERLLMRRGHEWNENTRYYQYDKQDGSRAHIMPSGVSHRGSIMWQVIDIKCNRSYWLERRDLSENIIKHFGKPVRSA